MEVSRSHSTDSSMILFLWHYPNFGVVNAVWPPPSPHSKVLTLLRPIRLQAGQIIDVEVILSREGIRSIQIPNPPFFYAPWAQHTIHITHSHHSHQFTSIHILTIHFIATGPVAMAPPRRTKRLPVAPERLIEAAESVESPPLKKPKRGTKTATPTAKKTTNKKPADAAGSSKKSADHKEKFRKSAAAGSGEKSADNDTSKSATTDPAKQKVSNCFHS